MDGKTSWRKTLVEDTWIALIASMHSDHKLLLTLAHSPSRLQSVIFKPGKGERR